jgi:ribonuclease HII
MAEKQQTHWWAEERAALARGFRTVAGIDEAGRGPLAGPVVAACVTLPPEIELPGVRDSKKLSPEQRERAFDLIHEHAAAVGVGIVEPAEIDTLNILRATHEAMRRAVGQLPTPPDFALIDGLPVQPFPVLQKALVKGDGRSLSIAAASVVAKVTRDRLMVRYDGEFPGYGFAEHKGYGTAAHIACIERLGPCAIHRRSFAPVSNWFMVEGVDPDGQAVLGFDRRDARRELGEQGETIAAAHLRRLGIEVVCMRWSCREGEIDVIGRDGATVVFAEVKARRGAGRAPAQAVTGPKRAKLAAAARAWLAENGGEETACRFDVLEIAFLADGRASVQHLRGAFMAGE